MTENHKKFQEHLKESTKALFIVAHYFHHHGYTIRINGQKCSPTASNHEEYADDGDLFIQTKEKWVRIEVKGLTTEFTNSQCGNYKNVSQEFYHCPLDKIKWVNIEI